MELIQYENAKIQWLLDVPAFNVVKSYSREEKEYIERRKNARWNVYNLIPSVSEGYAFVEEVEYRYKALCYMAARGVYSEMKKLYEEASLVTVYEIIMLHKAFEW